LRLYPDRIKVERDVATKVRTQHMTIPTLQDIDRIARLGEPIIRNLQITQCYYEISRSIAERIGTSANWCTFATWASKQAGQTIREEDLLRAFERRFDVSPEISAALETLQSSLGSIGAGLPLHLTRHTILRTLNPSAAFARAAEAVGRGNKKVFEEIGREFARFLEAFRDDGDFDRDNTERFCAALRPGEPPDGQRFLSEAFTAYCEARLQTGEEKIETMLLANLCAGFHEQIRLQLDIAEALNAALGDAAALKRELLNLVLPAFYLRARTRILGDRQFILDHVFDRLIQEVNRLIRQVITEHLMTLRLSGTEVLRLGSDLQGDFSQVLARIENARLREILARVDLTPDSLDGSGARDWADFSDRMHFIADFFRTHQERSNLFDPPFSAEQVGLLKSGVRPGGRL
jgi:hypothetical protein